MSEDNSVKRHKIIADFIKSLDVAFDVKIWLLVKIQRNPNSSIPEILGVSCSTVMQKGYSYDDLVGIVYSLRDEGHLTLSNKAYSLTGETSYNLTNFFTYIAEKFDNTGSSIYSEMKDCGYEDTSLLDAQTKSFASANISKKSTIFQDLLIHNAVPAAKWLSETFSRLSTGF